MSMANGNSRSNGNQRAGIAVTLESRPERRLIRPTGSLRHIDFCVRVGEFAANVRPDRTPLTLSLVLDRSGSMSGEKLATAKRAALAVLDRMDASDRVCLVVFDDRVDVVQPAALATPEIKRRIRAELARIEARANTALHEGWLIGCRAIAASETEPRNGGVARCFLLTDGQANAGITDPEEIAGEAAGVLEHTGIGTSTFGIGNDYNESLLGPMAVAGGGQFHHLRTAGEITNTFVGELGELLSVAVGHVRLELDGGRDITTEVISEYWASQPHPNASQVSVVVGDLPASEERHVVVRFGFPSHQALAERTVLARVVWSVGGEEHSIPWQEMGFTYADNRSCDTERHERMDSAAMHWVGLHHAERARREATQLSRRGDVQGARSLLEKVAKRIAEYAGSDPELQAAIYELLSLSQELSERPMDAADAKERYSQAQRRSRGQKDFRTI